VQIDFYGQLADRLGARHITVEDNTLTSGDALRLWLSEAHPELSDILTHKGTRLVLDDEISDWASPIEKARNIAIIPVVSGG